MGLTWATYDTLLTKSAVGQKPFSRKDCEHEINLSVCEALVEELMSAYENEGRMQGYIRSVELIEDDGD